MKGAKRLPLNLLDALRAFEKSTCCAQGLGEDLAKSYLKLKHDDWNAYSRHLTDWERRRRWIARSKIAGGGSAEELKGAGRDVERSISVACNVCRPDLHRATEPGAIPGPAAEDHRRLAARRRG